MKKSIIFLGLLLAISGLLVNMVMGYDEDEFKSSDELLIEKYCEEECPEADFDEVCIIKERTDSDYIGFKLIDDDEVIFDGLLDRTYMQKRIEK